MGVDYRSALTSDKVLKVQVRADHSHASRSLQNTVKMRGCKLFSRERKAYAGSRRIGRNMMKLMGGARVSDERQRVSSGTEWELAVGFSRAVRVDRFVSVSGTTATDEQGLLVGGGDVAAQTEYILRKIERALHEVGATLSDVVRTRIYVVNADDWQAIGRVHGKYFGEIRPANTLVEISKIVGDEYLVEIEVDAILPLERAR